MVRSVTMAVVVCASALVLAATPASAAAKTKSTAKHHHALAGTLEKVDGQTLTIKTGTQSESVMLSPTTHITQHGKAIQASQLSSDTGSHVSVKYTETNGQKQAQSVTVSSASTKTAKK
jgi:hypothetical protein